MTLGVWLPLALADILTWLAAIQNGKAPPFTREDVLRGWCLPSLADAVANDTDSARAESMINNFKKLAETYNGKSDNNIA